MIPTPEQAQQLVDHFGGQRAAARAVGVSYGALRYWLNANDYRSRNRKWTAKSARKRYSQETPAERERRLASLRAWRLHNHEQVLERERLYREQNRELLAAKQRAYVATLSNDKYREMLMRQHTLTIQRRIERRRSENPDIFQTQKEA